MCQAQSRLKSSRSRTAHKPVFDGKKQLENQCTWTECRLSNLKKAK